MMQLLNLLKFFKWGSVKDFDLVVKRAKIIAVASRKGGVGKTAITSLLARYFTEVGGKKLVQAVHSHEAASFIITTDKKPPV